METTPNVEILSTWYLPSCHLLSCSACLTLLLFPTQGRYIPGSERPDVSLLAQPSLRSCCWYRCCARQPRGRRRHHRRSLPSVLRCYSQPPRDSPPMLLLQLGRMMRRPCSSPGWMWTSSPSTVEPRCAGGGAAAAGRGGGGLGRCSLSAWWSLPDPTHPLLHAPWT